MGNKVIINDIKKMVESFNSIATSLEGIMSTLENEVMNAPVEPKEEKKTEVNEPELKADNDRAEELRKMKYNDMKKLASKLGVSAAGKREDIISRIIEAETSDETSDGTDDVKEEAEEEKPAPKKSKTPPKKKAEPKKEEKAEPDEFDTLAKEVLDENGDEAVIEELADHDIKATSKNVLTLLAKALREGVIDLEDEDDEEEPDTDEAEDTEGDVDADADDEGEDVTADTYFADYDEEGVNDPSSNTKERVEGMKKVMQEQIEAIENEEIDASDMKLYVQELSTKDEVEEQSEWEDDDFVAAYLEAKKRMVDNDGDEHPTSEAYEIGDDYFCCGHKLVFDKKSKEYICPVCEQTYEG